MHVLQKRSKEKKKKITRRKSLVCDHKLFFSYYGTGLCLLEWCGGAVRNFQAKEIERAHGARVWSCAPAGPHI